MRHRLDGEVGALDRLQPSDREDVITVGSRPDPLRQLGRMIQRLCAQAVVAREPVGCVLGVGEEAVAFAQHRGVQPQQLRAEGDVPLDVVEIGVRRAAQLVRRPVLVNQPGDLVRVAREVGGELRCDHAVDPAAVALREVHEAPRGSVREDLLLRVPLEGKSHPLGVVPARPELVHEAPHVQLCAAFDKRDLRFEDEDGHGTCPPDRGARSPEQPRPCLATGRRRRVIRVTRVPRPGARSRQPGADLMPVSYVANRKLMMSPSWTTYSLPSSRTSPWSRHAAIEPRPTSAS